MVNVINKTCAQDGCGQRPSFNIIGGKPLYCGSHRSVDMVNTMTKFCEVAGCLITPLYNSPETKTGRFCATHKEEGMINVVNKACEQEGCNAAPSYCLVGDSRPRFCGIHKTADMIDTKHKKCLGQGCTLTPSYAEIDDKVPKYCKTHALEGMVNVKHKKCEKAGCTQIPSYNFIGYSTARFCLQHKLDTMVDTVHKKCIIPECIRRPIYNTSLESKPLFCINHKTNEMIDVANKKCISEWCVHRSYRPSFLGYCTFCFIHMYPDQPAVRNYKTKEVAVAEYILTCFSEMTWIKDKRIQDGCSRRRPDLFLDLGYQVIIIEVDENQHIDYDCSCENKRIMELSLDVGHRPIVFIRFNPDHYLTRDSVKIKSCWSINSQGISVVNKNDSKEWKKRLLQLSEQVQYWIDNKTDKTVEIIQLYYDE
jgi:hypothetical protein